MTEHQSGGPYYFKDIRFDIRKENDVYGWTESTSVEGEGVHFSRSYANEHRYFSLSYQFPGENDPRVFLTIPENLSVFSVDILEAELNENSFRIGYSLNDTSDFYIATHLYIPKEEKTHDIEDLADEELQALLPDANFSFPREILLGKIEHLIEDSSYWATAGASLINENFSGRDPEAARKIVLNTKDNTTHTHYISGHYTLINARYSGPTGKLEAFTLEDPDLGILLDISLDDEVPPPIVQGEGFTVTYDFLTGTFIVDMVEKIKGFHHTFKIPQML